MDINAGWPLILPSEPYARAFVLAAQHRLRLLTRVARIERETPSYHGVQIELPASPHAE